MSDESSKRDPQPRPDDEREQSQPPSQSAEDPAAEGTGSDPEAEAKEPSPEPEERTSRAEGEEEPAEDSMDGDEEEPAEPMAEADEASPRSDEPGDPAEMEVEAEEAEEAAGLEDEEAGEDSIEFELRELKEVAKELDGGDEASEPPAEEPLDRSVEEELRELKDAASEDEEEGEGADRPSDEVEREIRGALDEEDGIPGEADEAPAEEGEGSAGEGADEDAFAKSEEAVERMRTLTGFRRAHLPLMLLLPPLTYYMWICLTFYGGRMVVPTTWGELIELISHVPPPTWQAALLFLGWMGLQVLFQIFAPGKIVYGEPLPDGRRLKYKMNGLFSFWTTMGLAVVLVVTGALPATILADQFGPLLTLGHIFAFGFSLYLYFCGKKQGKDERITGRPLYDYFMGTARNPRIGDFDLKLFFEARPGLLLWVLLNLSFAAKQLELHGTLTTPMILVCAFHFLYVADYFFHERAILSTMDIKHENFGWMLCWGDYPWVPFTYTVQAMYLVHHTHELAWWATLGIVALNLGGYVLFRAVNSQKDRFRQDPEQPIWGRKPEYIQTQRGTLLLTSGYWGRARHLNYLGDLMMALAWCLPCGFGHLLPYFYFIYFTWLLIHREWRDDKMCSAKYGRDWERYKEKVPWRIVPHVY